MWGIVGHGKKEEEIERESAGCWREESSRKQQKREKHTIPSFLPFCTLLFFSSCILVSFLPIFLPVRTSVPLAVHRKKNLPIPSFLPFYILLFFSSYQFVQIPSSRYICDKVKGLPAPLGLRLLVLVQTGVGAGKTVVGPGIYDIWIDRYRYRCMYV